MKDFTSVLTGILLIVGATASWHYWNVWGIVAFLIVLVGLGLISRGVS